MSGPTEPPAAPGAAASGEPPGDRANDLPTAEHRTADDASAGEPSTLDDAMLDPSAAEGASAPDDGRRLPPGAATFTIEGRAAPGLYFVGWVASVMGLGILLVGLLSGGGLPAVGLTLIGSAVLGVGLVSAAGAQAMERRARAERFAAYAGPSPFLVFGATLPLTILLVVLLLVPVTVLGIGSASPLADFLSLTATALVGIGLVRLLVVGPGALSWAEMGIRRFDARAAGDLAVGAAFTLPIMFLTGLVAAALVQLVGTTPDSILPPSTSLAGSLLNVVSAAIVAPVGEEVFYRGFATTAWARGMGDRGALIRGALFFAFIHVLTVGGSSFEEAAGRALVAFVVRIPLSLTLGWLFLRRRSIYASIGLHATYNGVLVILTELAVRTVA